MRKNEKTIQKVKQGIANNPKLSPETKAIALDQIIGDRELRNAEQNALDILGTHTVNKQDPKYNPGEVTAGAAFVVANITRLFENYALNSGRRSPKRLKASPSQISLWKNAARKQFAIDLRDHGRKQNADNVAKLIADKLSLNNARASWGTIRNHIKGIKGKVRNPAGDGESIDNLDE